MSQNLENPIKKIKESIKNFNDEKVWITQKTRMEAEARRNEWRWMLNILMNWYSVATLAFSVMTLTNPDTKFDMFNLLLSIFLLGISLIVTSVDFKEKANGFKVSYNQITKVENDLDDLILGIELGLKNDLDEIVLEYKTIKKEYRDILKNSENHSNFDYIRLARKKTNKKLKRTNVCMYVSYSYFIIIMFVVLLVLPLLLCVNRLL